MSDVKPTVATLSADLDKAFAEIDTLRERLASAEAAVADANANRNEANEAAARLREVEDELATIRAENDEIRRSISGGIAADDFATKAEVERVRTDLEAVRKDRADMAVTIDSAGLGGLEKPVTGFENGLMQHIVETYYSGEVARYRRAAENDARTAKSNG